MLLKRLSEAIGVSSCENEVRDIIRGELEGFVDDIRTDSLGNLIIYKDGKKERPKLMLAAHMDEIGLMITDITDDGLLSFKPVGGIDKRVLVSKTVLVGKEKVRGVIGAKAIHLQKPDERKKPLDYKELFIDIGSKSKKESEKIIDLGDLAIFDTEYKKLGANTAKGKAFDDRIGCLALIKILKESYDFPLYGVFTVQEEVGGRGAKVAAWDINPDLALVIEGTTAGDLPDAEEEDYSTVLGAGPALTIMDGATITDKKILNKLVDICEKREFKYQFRKFTKAGTDAGAIHLSREGIPTATISVPCRYIHSPVSLVNLDDYKIATKLIHSFCKEIERGEFIYEEIN